MVKPFGVTPPALRADRILDEARQTADPIHLMRLFGICDSTALKYVFTAHPERDARSSANAADTGVLQGARRVSMVGVRRRGHAGGAGQGDVGRLWRGCAGPLATGYV